MKTFLKKLLAFLILFLFTIGIVGLYNIEWRQENDYMAAIIDKHRALEETSAPRIIISGGSNTAFGIDSEKLSKEIGLPTINMGLQAGLGLEFILNELEENICEGDIIILSIEYFLDVKGNYQLMQLAKSYYPMAENYFDPGIYSDIKANLENLRKKFRYIILRDDPLEPKKRNLYFEVYKRSAFNYSGDIISHLDFKEYKLRELADKRNVSYRYWDGITTLNDFCKDASQKGAQVYYSFPPFPRSEWVKYAEPLHRFERDIINDATCLKFLNSAKEAVLDDKYFFDTVYHLGKEGRAIRTQALIEDLAAELAH